LEILVAGQVNARAVVDDERARLLADHGAFTRSRGVPPIASRAALWQRKTL
jgi:hypothetical protein